jgi:hypothetical protein
MNGRHPSELVGHADGHGSRLEARQRAVEEAGAVAQAIARAVPSVHREQEHGGDDGIRGRRIGDAEWTIGQRHTVVPRAKDEGLTWSDHHRQRGDGAPIAEGLRERPRIVFVADGPAEAEPRRGETGERALEMSIDPSTQAFDSGRVERLARGDQALTLALSPGGKLVGGHGHLVLRSSAFMAISCPFHYKPAPRRRPWSS